MHQNNTYTYDMAQRLHTVSANGVLLSTYSYNANGNRVSKVLSNGVRTDCTVSGKPPVTCNICNEDATMSLNTLEKAQV